MTLKLTLSDGRGTRTLSSGTLSIGRGERNDWVLPDPDRHLSKTHCVVSIENGAWILTDLSTNGVRINGARQPTLRDSRTILTDGDEVRLGDYTLFVSAGPASASARTPLGDDPLDVDPLADPFGRPPDPAFRHPVAPSPQVRRTDDPFDVRDESAHRKPAPDEDLFAGAKPAHEWSGPSKRDDADAPRHAMLAPRRLAPQAPPGEIDFDALIGDLSALTPHAPAARTPAPPPAPPLAPPLAPPPARPAPGPQVRDPFAEFDDLMAPHPAPPPAPPIPAPAPPAAPPALPPSDMAPPRQPAAPEPPPTPPPAPPTEAPSPHPAAATPDTARALAAFLEGAGVPTMPQGADPEAAMREAGRVFRALTEGLRDVLMSRAAIKNELRVDQTLLKSSNNNALKFSFSTDDAVIALLSAGRPGYMAPLAAAREAFDDLKTHEVAVMAGVQTALLGLLRRFDPESLEARLTTGKLASMLPAARKARLWESFRELHQTIAAEAEDDFQAVFGRAFAKAYTARAQKDDDARD